MNNLVTFRLTKVPNHYSDIVQRWAVLQTICQPVEDSDHVKSMTEQLILQWRARVTALADLGWNPRTHSRQDNASLYLYSNNCLPTFVMSKPRTRSCKLRLICPFCYARWVKEIWEQIDACFSAPDYAADEHTFEDHERREMLLDNGTITDEKLSESTTFPYHLVSRRHTFYRNVVPGGNYREYSVTQNLEDYLSETQKQRRILFERVDPAGAFMYTTIEPYDDGRQWKFCHRQLFKILPDRELPGGLMASTNGHLIRYCRPTRKVIMKAVAQACSYPRGLMYGDPQLTITLLAARQQSKFRGYSKYRSFRLSKYN